MVSVIDLNKILAGNSSEISGYQQQLERQGWALVRLPDELQKTALNTLKPLDDFFSKPVEYKQQFSIDNPLSFGYAAVSHRESLRTLTGERFNKLNLPPECATAVTSLVHAIDTVLIQLMCVTSKPIFGCKAAQLGHFLDLPLLNCETVANFENKIKPASSADPTGTQSLFKPAFSKLGTFAEKGAFGMLDIAHYFNKGRTASLAVNLNCAAHYDPGLLSLSVLSTAPGLEVYDPVAEQWVKGADKPSDIGLIWCGKAASDATNGRVKAGMHRVTFPPADQNRARLTMWTEICTTAQLHTNNGSDDTYSVVSDGDKKSEATTDTDSTTSPPEMNNTSSSSDDDDGGDGLTIANIATTDDGVPPQPRPDMPASFRAFLDQQNKTPTTSTSSPTNNRTSSTGVSSLVSPNNNNNNNSNSNQVSPGIANAVDLNYGLAITKPMFVPSTKHTTTTPSIAPLSATPNNNNNPILSPPAATTIATTPPATVTALPAISSSPQSTKGFGLREKIGNFFRGKSKAQVVEASQGVPVSKFLADDWDPAIDEEEEYPDVRPSSNSEVKAQKPMEPKDVVLPPGYRIVQMEEKYGIPTSKSGFGIRKVMKAVHKDSKAPRFVVNLTNGTLRPDVNTQSKSITVTKTKRGTQAVLPTGYRLTEIEEEYGVPSAKTGDRPTRLVIQAVPINHSSGAPIFNVDPKTAVLTPASNRLSSLSVQLSSSSSSPFHSKQHENQSPSPAVDMDVSSDPVMAFNTNTNTNSNSNAFVTTRDQLLFGSNNTNTNQKNSKTKNKKISSPNNSTENPTPIVPPGHRLIEVEEEYGVPSAKSGRRPRRKVLKAVPIEPEPSKVPVMQTPTKSHESSFGVPESKIRPF